MCVYFTGEHFGLIVFSTIVLFYFDWLDFEVRKIDFVVCFIINTILPNCLICTKYCMRLYGKVLMK